MQQPLKVKGRTEEGGRRGTNDQYPFMKKKEGEGSE